MNNPKTEPAVSELLKLFEDSHANDEKFVEKGISEVDGSGDLPKVSEELYNPSSNIFDGDIQKIYVSTPTQRGMKQVEDHNEGNDNISCASKYKLKHNGKLYAEIKNYHTLTYVDYSCTSLTYIPMNLDSMDATGCELFSMKFTQPLFKNSLDVVCFIGGVSYPYKVTYSNYTYIESLNSTSSIYSLSFPNKLKRGYGSDSLNVTCILAGFELKNGKISYTIPPDSLNSTAKIYDITRY